MISNEPTTTAEGLAQGPNAGADRPEAERKGSGSRIGRAIKGDTEAFHLRLVLANALLFFLPRGAFSRLRTAIYRACGIQIGRGTIIFGPLTLSGAGAIWKRLTIGSDCQINSPLFLDLNAEIRIGNGVAIGHHVVLVTAEHEVGPATHRCGSL